MLSTTQSRILKKFSDLVFKPEKHQYFLDGQYLPSVSSLVRRHIPPFDSEKMLPLSAIKASRIENREVTVHELKRRWQLINETACELGTKAHAFMEHYTGLETPSIPQEEAGIKYIKSLKNKYKISFRELRAYSKKYAYAGTMDLPLQVLGTNKEQFVIDDYKGLPLDTPIFTNNGWKTMGTLTLLDKVFDKEGKLTNIKVISNIKNKKCYKMDFGNGESIISDFEHRWLVSFMRLKKFFKEVVMTTEELHLYLKGLKRKNKRHSYQIPKIRVCKPLDIEYKELPIDPYVFGIWLGDGHSADGKITCMDELVWEQIRNRGYEIGKDISQGGAGKAQTKSIFGIHKKLKDLGVLYNKHLPDIYLNCSYNQRLEVLRGLMDSDGYYNKTRRRFVMATTKIWQAEATKQIVSSLGIKATMIECEKYIDNKVIRGYDVCFSTGDFNPFLVRNQEINTKPLKDQYSFRNIDLVEEVNSVPTICIEVESINHTFLVGYNFIVTHNTNTDLFKAYDYMYPPFETLEASPYNADQLQLSYYQIMLEEQGLEVVDRRVIHLKADGEFRIFPLVNLTRELKDYMKHIAKYN